MGHSIQVLCITGTRADYGIYRSLLKRMEQDPDMQLKLVVTGMHLVAEYGNTIAEIQQDGYDIVSSPLTLLKGDSTAAMSVSVGLGVMYFTDAIKQHSPDFVLLLGDRGEMLAAAIAAHYLNVGIVHLHGGELSGSADDVVRHAISKFAHLHFVSCIEAKQNLLRMGEEDWRIVPCGSLRKTDIMSLQALGTQPHWDSKFHLAEDKPAVIVAFHPDSKDSTPFHAQIERIVEALESLEHVNIIIIGANSDAGGEQFNRALISLSARKRDCRYYASVPSQEYLYLLSEATVLVGNSSSGIIEAPFFRLPFVLIGNRQQNRTQGGNVVQVPYDSGEIIRVIELILKDGLPFDFHNPYDLHPSPELEMVTRLKNALTLPNLLNKTFL